MNEASVSAPLMKGLREALSGSVVFKHRDASMVGMPDCSVTWANKTTWLEFKLYEWQEWMECRAPNDIALRLLEKAKAGGPTQWATMDRLDRASKAWYVIWVKKHMVYLISPDGDFSTNCLKTSDMVDYLVNYLRA